MPCRSRQSYPFWLSISAHSFELEAGKSVKPGPLLTGMGTCSHTKWTQMAANHTEFTFFLGGRPEANLNVPSPLLQIRGNRVLVQCYSEPSRGI